MPSHSPSQQQQSTPTQSVRSSSRSPPSSRTISARFRNSRSLPDWIDKALFKAIHDGDDQTKSYIDLERELGFATWLASEPNYDSARQKLRNRLKYLGLMRREQPANFMLAYNNSINTPAPPASTEAPVPSRHPPTVSPAPTEWTTPAARPPTVAGGGDDRAQTAAVHFEVRSNAASSSSSSSQSTVSLRNSFNQLDFDRPENNPNGWWPVRNRNYT